PMSNPAFAALQAVGQGQARPERYAQEHLQGFAMDVHGREYITIDDTLEYCYHVAGVVGLMMAVIMGAKGEATLDRACDLGLAFQLTNIARDIVEDARNDRCYLPAQWLSEEGVPRKELALPAHRPAVARLAARLVDLAEPYYASANQGLLALPLRSAWAIATARGVYREIGIKVKARGAAAWDQRVSTSKGDKLRLVTAGAVQALASRRFQIRPRGALWTRPRQPPCIAARRAIHATAFSAWRPTARQENQRKHSPHAHAPRGASNAPGRGVSGSRCAAHGGTASGGAPARHGPESTENRKPSYPRRPTPEDANRPYRARSALSPHLQIP